jgi:hypothetical protein
MAVTPFEQTFEGSSSEFYQGGGTASYTTAPDPVYQGTRSRKFEITGVAGGIARLNETVDWATLGTDVYYGCALFLPIGFYSAQNAQVRIMGWTDFNGSTQKVRSGIWINTGDDCIVYRHVENSPGNNEQTSLIAIGNKAFKEGRWTEIDVHQILSETDGQALSEIWLDGVLKGRTTTHNIKASLATGDITRMRWGFDDATSVTNPVSLVMDRCYVNTTRQLRNPPFANVTVGG